MALGEALAVGTEHQRHVRPRRTGPPEQVEQVRLARRRLEQVVGAHHLLHPLVVVVDDDGHVVRGHAVVAAQHDVVGRPGDVAAQPVDDRDRLAVAAQPQGRRSTLGLPLGDLVGA